MTSDAKIGLLLGLVFIFIIAFIINGLPTAGKETDSNKLTATMISSEHRNAGIGAVERRVTRELINAEATHKYPLPSITKAEEKPVYVMPDTKTSSPAIPQEKQPVAIQPIKPTWPKLYVVHAGDNLALIAKKFYGPDQGNKAINVKRIFEANQKTLKLPDQISTGQKLTIPSLLTNRTQTTKDSLAGSLFEKVKSIGQRHFSANSHKNKAPIQYIVKPNDNLWQIAAEKLGNGKRYTEIITLNSNVLHNKDTLAIGMRLKLPVQ